MSVFDNRRYKNLKLAEGVFVPDIGMEYPEDDPDARLVPAVKVRDLRFDENYKFIDDSLSFKLGRTLIYCLLHSVYGFINWLFYGLRFEGRDVLRRYRKEFSDGIVSVANHCYPWDGMAIAMCLNRRLWIPMLSDHINGKSHWHLTHFGGIPLAEPTVSATKKFNEAFDTLHARKNWVHIFAEARNWHFYKPLRPFQKGAFTMAYKWGCPILPIALDYRPRTGFFRLTGPAEKPLITVKIGEPIFPDTSKPRRAEVDRLLRATHASICSLAGIVENSWPASREEFPECDIKL